MKNIAALSKIKWGVLFLDIAIRVIILFCIVQLELICPMSTTANLHAYGSSISDAMTLDNDFLASDGGNLKDVTRV